MLLLSHPSHPNPPQGATARSGPGPPHCRGFTIHSFTHTHTTTHTHTHTLHSIGLLWTSDQPDAETSTWHHTKLTSDRVHAAAGFEPAIPASKRPQTHRVATGIGMKLLLGFWKFNYVIFPRYIFYRTSQWSSVHFGKSHLLLVSYAKLKYGFVMLRNWI